MCVCARVPLCKRDKLALKMLKFLVFNDLAKLEFRLEGQVMCVQNFYLKSQTPYLHHYLCQVFDLAPSCESQLVTPQ